MSISVAMAVYNGERYISQQLDSILLQLKENDEILISDDGSSDNTVNIINNYRSIDKRIKLLKGPSKGVIKNFEYAISLCKNDIIFLSDQDDVWLGHKVESVLKCFFETNAELVLHDAIIVDENLYQLAPSCFDIRKAKNGLIKNIIKSSYFGCCMAFKRQFILDILPFPDMIPAHDQWIGIIAEKEKVAKLLPIPLVLYRKYGTNLSIKRSFFERFYFRYKILWCLVLYNKNYNKN